MTARLPPLRRRARRALLELEGHCRGMPCSACGAEPPGEPLTIRPEPGAGPAWCECPRCLGDGQGGASGVCEDCDGSGSVGNVAPLCGNCRGHLRAVGLLVFCAEHGVNLATVARDVGAGYRAARWVAGH